MGSRETDRSVWLVLANDEVVAVYSDSVGAELAVMDMDFVEPGMFGGVIARVEEHTVLEYEI